MVIATTFFNHLTIFISLHLKKMKKIKNKKKEEEDEEETVVDSPRI
ncbi:unnamed protein product [Camellia sinensis]